MTLASLYPLGWIKPAWTATFCGLHALAVDDAGRGRALASHQSTSTLDKSSIDPAPNLRVAPTIEVILNRRARRKFLRQSAPLAAGSEDVKDCVQHRAKINLPRSSNPSSLGKQWRNHFPLVVRQITCIAQVITPILLAGGFGPRHVGLPRRFATTKESQQGQNHSLLFRPASQDEGGFHHDSVTAWRSRPDRLCGPGGTGRRRPRERLRCRALAARSHP